MTHNLLTMDSNPTAFQFCFRIHHKS